MMPLGERLDGVALRGVERAEPRAEALELGLAELLGPVVQRGDERRATSRAERWRR